jgi:hypothetical protein
MTTAEVDRWFARLDRFADVPFMEDGRRQPPMPVSSSDEHAAEAAPPLAKDEPLA